MALDLSLHIPVLDEEFRAVTDGKSGLIPVEEALRRFSPASKDGFGENCVWLGGEFPVYEVEMGGAVYRLLLRKRTSDAASWEAIRVAAPARTASGFVLEPGPGAIPNTPMALVREIAYVTGYSEVEVAERATSLKDYRRLYGKLAPDAARLAGFQFDRWFLLETNGGNVASFFDTPPGVNAETWTVALNLIESHEPERLMDYAVSKAPGELGPKAASLLLRALRLRAGHTYTPRAIPMGSLISQKYAASEWSALHLRRQGPVGRIRSLDYRPMEYTFTS